MTDVKYFAEKVLRLTKNRAPNDTYPLPVKHLRSMAQHILNKKPDIKRPPLTDVETKVLAAIKGDFAQGIQPTAETIAERLGYKTRSSANVVVQKLIKHGYIKRSGSKKQIVLVN